MSGKYDRFRTLVYKAPEIFWSSVGHFLLNRPRVSDIVFMTQHFCLRVLDKILMCISFTSNYPINIVYNLINSQLVCKKASENVESTVAFLSMFVWVSSSRSAFIWTRLSTKRTARWRLKFIIKLYRKLVFTFHLQPKLL